MSKRKEAFMRILIMVVLTVFVFSPINSFSQKLTGGGNMFISLQYWEKIGMKNDPKIGLGLSGTMGVGIMVDTTVRVIVGPHIAYNMWEANYANKPQSYTQTVYTYMMDAGPGVVVNFYDTGTSIQIATGKSQISSGMILKDGRNVKYPYNRNFYTFYYVALGFKTKIFEFGLGYTSYSGYAKYCNRLEFLFGIEL